MSPVPPLSKLWSPWNTLGRASVTNTTNKYSHCLYTANNDRKSKGEESDTASVVINTYRVLSWVVVFKRPSGSPVNWLFSSHLRNERPNKPVNLLQCTCTQRHHQNMQQEATWRMRDHANKLVKLYNNSCTQIYLRRDNHINIHTKHKGIVYWLQFKAKR